MAFNEKEYLKNADDIIDLLAEFEAKDCQCDGEYIDGRPQVRECNSCKAKGILDLIVPD